MFGHNQRNIRFLLVLFILGLLYLDVVVVLSVGFPSFLEDKNHSVFRLQSQGTRGLQDGSDATSFQILSTISISGLERLEDPIQLVSNGTPKDMPIHNPSISQSFDLNTPSLSIIPYLDVQGIRYLPLEEAIRQSAGFYSELLDMCEKNKLARITITDLFSFRDWWEHLSVINRNRFISVLNEGRISFNLGVWSLPDVSLLRYTDLIDIITTGTRWIYSNFQIVVTTGMIMGGYEYPRGILTVLERAGIEMLVVYHSSTNTVYYCSNSNPFVKFYGHAGLDSDGETFMADHSNLYVFSGDRQGQSIFDRMIVVHAYGDETWLINNLVNIGCGAEQKEKDHVEVWFDEVIRWMLTQCSTNHPNNQHVLIFFNVLSNKCSDLQHAFSVLQYLQEYLNRYSSSIFHFNTLISSLQEYSYLLSQSHGNSIPVYSSSVYPYLSLSHRTHHEIGVYANRPDIKYTIRHFADFLSYMRFFSSFSIVDSDKRQDMVVQYPLQYAKRLLGFAQSRYYKGAIAIPSNLKQVQLNITAALSLLADIHNQLHIPSEPDVTFSLDDTLFAIPDCIFQKTVEMNSNETVAIRVTNKQTVFRNSIISFQVGISDLCAYDNQLNLQHFQVYVDFENTVWLFVEVSVPPVSFTTLFLKRCDSSAYESKTMSDLKESTLLGTKDFGVVLQNSGLFETLFVKNQEIPFRSELGFYLGGVERRARTGHRLFSNQEGRKFISTVKAMGNFIVTDGGLASFVTESKTVEVLVEKGPLFTQLTQYYSNDVALITRVFSPKNPDSHFKYTLQQQALVAKINITQEISYFMQSPISNNQTLVIDEADYDLRTIQTDAKPGMGYNFYPAHSFVQMKETSKQQGLRSITVFSDRLHASGYHQSQGSIEVLLRRTSQWADIADYPEPFTNVWIKEKNRGTKQQHDKNMFANKKGKKGNSSRKLMELNVIRDPYHRFFYLMKTNIDREMQNLRMEDEEPDFIDRINFFVHFDMFENEIPVKPFVMKEQLVDPLYLSSTIIPSRNISSILSDYQFLKIDSLPPFIRIVDISKPVANMDALVIVLRNIYHETEDPTHDDLERANLGFDLCTIFNHRSVKSIQEMDITGTFSIDTFSKIPFYWKRKSVADTMNCKPITIKPGDIRSYRVAFE